MPKNNYTPKLNGLETTTQEFAKKLNELKNEVLSLDFSADDVYAVDGYNYEIVKALNTIKFIKKQYNKKFTDVSNELKNGWQMHNDYTLVPQSFDASFDSVTTKAWVGNKETIKPNFSTSNLPAVKFELKQKYPEYVSIIDYFFPETIDNKLPKTMPMVNQNIIDFINALKNDGYVTVIKQLELDI